MVVAFGKEGFRGDGRETYFPIPLCTIWNKNSLTCLCIGFYPLPRSLTSSHQHTHTLCKHTFQNVRMLFQESGCAMIGNRPSWWCLGPLNIWCDAAGLVGIWSLSSKLVLMGKVSGWWKLRPWLSMSKPQGCLYTVSVKGSGVRKTLVSSLPLLAIFRGLRKRVSRKELEEFHTSLGNPGCVNCLVLFPFP